MRSLGEAARDVSSGNLTAHAPVTGGREVAAVAEEFNRMLDARDGTERALRESEEKLRLFIDHAPAAIAMFDRDMRYLAFSRRWLADYGLEGRDISGRSHYEVFPDLPQRWKEVHRRCLAGATEGAEDDPFSRTDGSTDFVRWGARPWRGRDGGIAGIMIFSEMVTARRRAEQALAQSEERFRKVFAGASVPMSISAANAGTLLEVNEAFCAFFDFSRAELIGRTTIELGLWADPDARKALTERLGAEGHVRDFEARRRLRSGELRDVLVSVDMMQLGGERCTLAILLDITGRKRAEGQIRQKLAELRRWYEVTLGREDRVRQLKGEVNELRAQLGEPARYLKPEDDKA